MRATLSMVRDASEMLGRLLEGRRSTIAGRLAGAFRNIGHDRIANFLARLVDAGLNGKAAPELPSS